MNAVRERLDTKLKQYKTVTKRTKKSILDKFFEQVGDKEDYDEYDAINFMEWAKDHYKDTSLQQIYTNILWFYKKILKKDISDDLVRPEVEEYRAPVMSANDVVKCIQTAKTMNPLPRALTAMSTIYGVRRDEMQMKPEDIDLTSGLLYIRTAKRGLRRWSLIPKEAYNVFLAWKLRFSTAQLTALSAYFHKICYNAGVDPDKYGGRVGWHSIRRRLILELTHTDLSDYQINTFLRWSTSDNALKMLYHYRSMSGDEELIDKVDKPVFAVHPFLQHWE